MDLTFELSFYKGKTVFLTGHTGFKGSWLSKILAMAGAEVYGYALPQPEGQDTPDCERSTNVAVNVSAEQGGGSPHGGSAFPTRGFASPYTEGRLSLHGGSALPTRGVGSPYTEKATSLH